MSIIGAIANGAVSSGYAAYQGAYGAGITGTGTAHEAEGA